jgi:renalase
MNDTSCLVIGAGMAGLTAARYLHEAGWAVTVLDKGRGVGGRLASRSVAGARFDHGAQYFSAKTPDFQKHVADWQAAGVAAAWHLEKAAWAVDAHPRYIGQGGMSTIAKHLAEVVPVRTSEKVVRLRAEGMGVCAETERGQVYTARYLILTAPVPQSIALLDADNALPARERALLEGIGYEPCVAVMAVLDAPSAIPAPGGIKFENAPIAWLADNQQKGISAVPSVTIHASPAFSRTHFDYDLTQTGQRLLDHAAAWVQAGTVRTFEVHRWRYSLAARRHQQEFVALEKPFPVLLGGDAFGMGNVEGAFRSGRAMAQRLLTMH